MMKKPKYKPMYKVYVTYYTDNTFYVGMSSKAQDKFAKYFGSNKTDKEINYKKVLFTTSSKTDAKLYELILQLQNLTNPRCNNDMLNIRLRRSHIKCLPNVTITTDEDL